MLRLLVLFAAPMMSSPEYRVREAGEALARLMPWPDVRRLMLTHDDPEVRVRMLGVHARVVARDLDAMFATFPRADRLGWPSDPNEYADCVDADTDEIRRDWRRRFPEMFVPMGRWLPVENDDEEDPRRTEYHPPTDEEQRERTRTALIRYVGRTGDWSVPREYTKSRYR